MKYKTSLAEFVQFIRPHSLVEADDSDTGTNNSLSSSVSLEVYSPTFNVSEELKNLFYCCLFDFSSGTLQYKYTGS